MYSILDVSNTEKSKSKDGNDFIEFQEYHDTLFQKNILRHTMGGIKSKIIIFSPMKLINYLYHVLMINDIFSKWN